MVDHTTSDTQSPNEGQKTRPQNPSAFNGSLYYDTFCGAGKLSPMATKRSKHSYIVVPDKVTEPQTISTSSTDLHNSYNLLPE